MSLVNRLRGRKGTGWRPDKSDKRDFIFASDWQEEELPKGVDLSPWEPPIWDQSHTNSCVSHAVLAAIALNSKKAGKPTAMLSRLFAYWNSRKAHRMSWIDSGTYIRVCAEQIRRVGVCLEKDWNFLVDKINERPSWRAYMQAVRFWDYRYYKIKSTGEYRVREVMKALADGYPVVFGTLVPEEWVKNRAPSYDVNPSVYDKFVGGHAMVITGYEVLEGGEIVFDVRNSWGESWCNGGHIMLGKEWIKWEQARDFTVFTGFQK